MTHSEKFNKIAAVAESAGKLSLKNKIFGKPMDGVEFMIDMLISYEETYASANGMKYADIDVDEYQLAFFENDSPAIVEEAQDIIKRAGERLELKNAKNKAMDDLEAQISQKESVILGLGLVTRAASPALLEVKMRANAIKKEELMETVDVLKGQLANMKNDKSKKTGMEQ